jgi:hypothetical protein
MRSTDAHRWRVRTVTPGSIADAAALVSHSSDVEFDTPCLTMVETYDGGDIDVNAMDRHLVYVLD